MACYDRLPAFIGYKCSTVSGYNSFLASLEQFINIVVCSITEFIFSINAFIKTEFGSFVKSKANRNITVVLSSKYTYLYS